MMTGDWQAFDGVAAKYRRTKMHVTLAASKDFYLNRIALEALGEPEAVRYFFDVGRSWIGIKKESADCEQAFPVRKKANGQGGGLVRAGHFCNRYGLLLESSISFQEIRIDADGMLILDLKTVRRIRR